MISQSQPAIAAINVHRQPVIIGRHDGNIEISLAEIITDARENEKSRGREIYERELFHDK